MRDSLLGNFDRWHEKGRSTIPCHIQRGLGTQLGAMRGADGDGTAGGFGFFDSVTF